MLINILIASRMNVVLARCFQHVLHVSLLLLLSTALPAAAANSDAASPHTVNENLQKFLGKWQGNWNGNVDFTVEFMTINTDDTVSGVVQTGNYPQFQLTDTPISFTAKTEDNTVIASNDGYTVTYWFEGEVLKARLSGKQQGLTQLEPYGKPSSTQINIEVLKPDGLNKFEPQDGQVLLFLGQDNAGVGGNRNVESKKQQWNHGYLDAKLPVPAGITSYIALRDDSKNPNANVPQGKTIAGLHNMTDYGAGPVCLQCYISASTLDMSNTAIHLSIYFADDATHAARIASGALDPQIQELADFLLQHKQLPFFLRPGYEFEYQYGSIGVSADDYKAAFQRIVDKLREAGATNFATVFAAASSNASLVLWQEYFPGPEYVDWLGFSAFHTQHITGKESVLAFAKAIDRPIMIAESTPMQTKITDKNSELLWQQYFQGLFSYAELAPKYIKAIAYINTNWSTHALWKDVPIFQNTDSRIQNSSALSKKWHQELTKTKYILGDDSVFKQIRFNP